MMDTFDDFTSSFDLMPEDDRKIRLQRLVNEDAALRPWLIGKALREADYSRWDRIKVVFRETLDAARWAWRMSR